jgi:hypothetical protein
MIRTGLLLGLVPAVLLAPGLRAQIVVDRLAARAPWPSELEQDFRKIDTGTLFETGVTDALVLAGEQLIVVRSVGSAPIFGFVADGVTDFAILPPDSSCVSKFVASDESGLWLGQADVVEGGPVLVLGLQLGDGSWSRAESLSVAREAATSTVVVAAASELGDAVLRGRFEGDLWTDFDPRPVVGEVLEVVALDFDLERPGIEFAYATAVSMQVLDAGAATLSGPYGTSDGFRRIARIPQGNGVDDSLAYGFDQLYGNGLVGELLCEVDRNGVKDAIHAGSMSIHDLHVARLGSDDRADIVAVSPVTHEVVALHGTDHDTSAVPFWVQEDEIFQVPLGAQVFDAHVPTAPRVACADVDADGFGDVVLVSQTTFGEPSLFLVGGGFDDVVVPIPLPNPCGIITRPEDIEPIPFEFDIPIEVPRPSNFTEDPNVLRVKVYTRASLASPIDPAVWYAHDFLVENGATTIEFIEEADLDEETALFYLELQVGRFVEPYPEVLVERAAKTAWVGAASATTIHELFCAEEDSFTPEVVCPPPPGGAPLVTAINRRTVIQPMALSPGLGN